MAYTFFSSSDAYECSKVYRKEKLHDLINDIVYTVSELHLQRGNLSKVLHYQGIDYIRPIPEELSCNSNFGPSYVSLYSWLKKNTSNYLWFLQLGIYLCLRFESDYGKKHEYFCLVNNLMLHVPENIELSLEISANYVGESINYCKRNVKRKHPFISTGNRNRNRTSVPHIRKNIGYKRKRDYIEIQEYTPLLKKIKLGAKQHFQDSN